MRNKYWIPACRCIIRNIILDCFYCKGVDLRSKAQIMAKLPQEHLLINDKAFASTGVH